MRSTYKIHINHSFQFALLILFTGLTIMGGSCIKDGSFQSSSDTSVMLQNLRYKNGKIQFVLTPSNFKRVIDTATPQKILFDILDPEGNEIMKNRSATLKHENDNYSTDEISIKTGNFRITKFLVLNYQNDTIYYVPDKGSDNASFVRYPLSIDSLIYPNKTSQIFPEIISKNEISEDYILLTTNQTILKSVSIIISKNSTKPLMIDWGDNSLKSAIIDSAVHSYVTTGTYNIRIFGEIASILTLMVEGSNIINVDISKALELNNLDVMYNMLTDLDITKLKALISLRAGMNELSTIDITKNKNLNFFEVVMNHLSTIDFSANTLLEYVSVWGNNLNSVDVSMLPNLQTLVCENINSIDVSQNSKLSELSITNAPINNIDVSKNSKLEYLTVTETNISNLNIQNNELLKFLDISSTSMISIDLSHNNNLESLVAPDSKLTSLDITMNKKLKHIWFTKNFLQQDEINKFYLDLFNNVSMENLINGTLYISGLEPTGDALTAKQNLINQYGWVISNDF